MSNKLFEILIQKSRECFIASHVESADPQELSAETLGIMLSQFFEYDGEKVGKFLLRALYSGLEDANWHTEAGIVYDWVNQLDSGAKLQDLPAFQEETDEEE